ncbi:hypothetical protein BpHYR1_007476 [Brachionus plicatilis]|uniref:Uncharacterized protein n=1 Tax=Brachionus plicatilis TaxID=10195 RepID=A0A3M7Q5I1_BRAPC|nr:hypothetical protein BpHYR1_007476 [Brachionus plicatilis]
MHMHRILENVSNDMNLESPTLKLCKSLESLQKLLQSTKFTKITKSHSKAMLLKFKPDLDLNFSKQENACFT